MERSEYLSNSNKKTLMQSTKYAKIVFIMSIVLLENFDEQQTHGRRFLTWENSYKSLNYVCSLAFYLQCFCQFILLVAIATHHIQRFGLNAYIL